MSTAPRRPVGSDDRAAWTDSACCGPGAATARALSELEAGSWDRVALAVAGPRGSGRTHILRELHGAARRRGFAVLSASATADGDGPALAVFRQWFDRAVVLGAAVPADVHAVFDEAFGRAAAGVARAVDPRRLVEATVHRLGELATVSPIVVLLDHATPASDDLAAFATGVQRDLPVGVSMVRVGGPTDRSGPHRETVVEVTPWCPLHAPGVLDRLARAPAEPVRGRLLAQAAGHPLALSELGRQAADHPEWGQPGFVTLPLPPHLVEVFAPGLRELPSATREGLAVAAATRGELGIVRTVVGDLESDPYWSVAVDNGWVRVRGRRVHFRHPMVRAAAYHAVTPSRMRLVHRRIAAAVEPDVATAAWHRAAGGAAPAETLALELEHASVRLTRLGASRAAIEAMAVAASVTPDAEARDHRRRQAARLARAVDLPEWADSLDVAPPAHPPDVGTGSPAGRAAFVDALASAVDDLYRTGRVSQRHALLLDQVPNPAGATGRTTAADATLRSWVGALLDLATLRDAAAALVGDVALIAALAGVAESTATPRTALDRLVGKAALLLDETGVAVERLLAAAAPARRSPQVESDAAEALAWALVDAGRVTEAEEWATRIVRSRRRAVGDRSSAGAEVALAVVDAGVSPSPDARFAAAAALFDPDESPYLAVRLHRARAAAAAAAGRHDDAWRRLRAIWSDDGRPRHDLLSDLAIGDLAAAAAHTHRGGDASELLRRVESRQGESASLRQRLVLHRARALLVDENAEEHFRWAFEHPGAAGWPQERAAVQLDYAEWLRRQRRAADARPQLSAARDAFTASSMPVWADRAAHELATARGARTVSPGPGALTSQQRRIADLAAQGMSDREIAAQLFVSVRTVTTHMTHIFRSLGVQRRMHLAAAIAELDRR